MLSKVWLWFESSALIKESVSSITHAQPTPNLAVYVSKKINDHSVSTLLDSGVTCSGTSPLQPGTCSLLNKPN